MFAELSKAVPYTDIIFHGTPHDLVNELRLAELSEDGVLVERFFLGRDRETVISVKYFVTHRRGDPNAMHSFTISRLLYGSIDAKSLKPLKAAVISADDWDAIGSKLRVGNAVVLKQLRDSADKKQDFVYWSDQSRWNAVLLLMETQTK